jgi:hypothetical protein
VKAMERMRWRWVTHFVGPRGGKLCRDGRLWESTGGGERWWCWSSSAGEAPGARWHELCCTEGVLWDLREGEETH